MAATLPRLINCIRPSSAASAAKNFLVYLQWLLLKKRISNLGAIFVLGCQHSGTSIVHRLLGYHTGAFQIPQETYWFNGKSLNARSKSQIIGILSIMDLFHADVLLEKTPSSYRQVGLIRKTFPHSKIIYMLRDPRDVCASLKHRGSSLIKACAEWAAAAETILSNQGNSAILVVKLEDLLLDPDGKLKEIQDFCGLEWEDLIALHGVQPKRFYAKSIERPETVENGSSHNMHRNWQINQPLFSNSSRWKTDLSQEDVCFVNSNLSSLAQKLGYSMSCGIGFV